MKATHNQTGNTIKFLTDSNNRIIQEGGRLESMREGFYPEYVGATILVTIARGYDNDQIKTDVTRAVKQELHNNYDVEFDYRDNLQFLSK